MSKELPYWQFEPAEYLTKDVSFCSLSAQGLFINICSYYWQRDCELTQNQLLKRLNHPKEMEELIKEGVIDLEDDNIIIKFLDNQRDKAIETSNKNSKNGKKGGRPKNPIKTDPKPNLNPTEAELKAIKEKEIKEKEKTKKYKTDRAKKFASSIAKFKSDYKDELLKAFYEYWTESGEDQKKMRFEFEKVFDIKKRLVTWHNRQRPDQQKKVGGVHLDTKIDYSKAKL